MTDGTVMGLALRTALVGIMAIAVPGAAAAQGALDLEGLWLVRVQLRICQTQAPLGAPFNSLVSFLPGGAVVESTEAAAFAAGQRPPAHGRWTRLGPRTFSQRMLALVAFDTPPNPPVSPGFVRGGAIVLQTVEMTGPDAFTSTGSNVFYDAAAQPYRTGCATAVGQRFP